MVLQYEKVQPSFYVRAVGDKTQRSFDLSIPANYGPNQIATSL